MSLSLLSLQSPTCNTSPLEVKQWMERTCRPAAAEAVEVSRCRLRSGTAPLGGFMTIQHEPCAARSTPTFPRSWQPRSRSPSVGQLLQLHQGTLPSHTHTHTHTGVLSYLPRTAGTSRAVLCPLLRAPGFVCSVSLLVTGTNTRTGNGDEPASCQRSFSFCFPLLLFLRAGRDTDTHTYIHTRTHGSENPGPPLFPPLHCLSSPPLLLLRAQPSCFSGRRHPCARGQLRRAAPPLTSRLMSSRQEEGMGGGVLWV